MLSLGKFPSQPQCYDLVVHKSVSPKVFLLPTKTHLIQLFSSPNGVAKVGFCGQFARSRTGFSVCATKSQGKGGNDLLEMDDFEDFDVDDDDLFEEEVDLEEEGEDDDEEEEEGEFIPLNNMKKWQRNKPRGFGEGKEYDTSVEDKLMEEIEQSRRAQLANINKLKNNPVKPNSKKESVQKDKIAEELKDAFRVRLVNLPKKKNIHRDLRLAFEGVPGIVDIAPVVSGNKKTRDPICKGLGFVTFKSENDAYRFVQNFSGKSIKFGKAEKQIKCEMTTPLLEHGYEQFAEETSYNARLAEPGLEASEGDVSFEFENPDEMHEPIQAEGDGEDLETRTQLESKWDGDTVIKEEVVLDSTSSVKKKQEIQEKDKKLASKRKKKNVPKFNIPGSANRLKIREKEVLTGVFSKYGANASLATRSSDP